MLRTTPGITLFRITNGAPPCPVARCNRSAALAFKCSFAFWRNLRPVRTHTRPPLACVRDDSVAKFNGVTVTFRITIKLKSKSIRRIKHSHNHQYRQCKSIHRITHCSMIQLNAPRLAKKESLDRYSQRLRSISGLIRVERPLSGFRLLNQLFDAEQSGLVRK